MKSVGPKLVPFFKTVAIFFVLFPEESYLASIFYCICKCLPIISLILFVLLHGMNFKEEYTYARRVLIGLVFSCAGDALLVWKNQGFFIHGLLAFAVAQLMYARAFGMKPTALCSGAVCTTIGSLCFAYLYPGLKGVMVYFGGLYVVLISFMAWRALARVKFFDDNWVWRDELWTWTKLCSCGGALFFMVSDLIIAVDRFRFPIPYSHQMIMFTYYAAQLGIALSVVDSQVDVVMARTAKEAKEDTKLDYLKEPHKLNGIFPIQEQDQALVTEKDHLSNGVSHINKSSLCSDTDSD